MSKGPRDIPKLVATFGEKQFKETGASAVEVLRVKEAFIRKHFRQLRGILYLVAVVSLDRVRVYFFNSAGVMVIGENLEPSLYEDIRKSSKLVAKFQKPKKLTPEELRIEVTQEIRDALGKAIRRVSRTFALKEPEFPDIYIIRESDTTKTQSFGFQITEDNEILFEETAISRSWSEGILLRTAFLLHLSEDIWRTEIAICVGSAVTFSLLKDPMKTAWLNEWRKHSKDSDWEPIVNHFIAHSSTYHTKGFIWILQALNKMPSDVELSSWSDSLSIIHDSLELSLGTEAYHAISGFCATLSKPQQLTKKRYTLESIHLSPRIICNPASIGISLGLNTNASPSKSPWASILFVEGTSKKALDIIEGTSTPIQSIEYWLNIEDLFPITGGPLSHGRHIILRALEKLGVRDPIAPTYEAVLNIDDRVTPDSKEKAVLERLILGDLQILLNTLVGSPLIIKNLTDAGLIIFLPDFNHIHIRPNYLIQGEYEDVSELAHSSLESTLFKSKDSAYAILSAPTSWRESLVDAIATRSVSLWPILSTRSSRRILRDECIFPIGDGPHSWDSLTHE